MTSQKYHSNENISFNDLLTPTPTTEKYGGVPICLYSNQIHHVTALYEILRSNFFAIDLSMLGSGKTYTGAALYQKMYESQQFQHCLVIASTDVLVKWNKITSDFKLPNVISMTYDQLASKRTKKTLVENVTLSHGLLIRRDHEYQEPIKSGPKKGTMLTTYETEFFQSPYCLRLIEEGLLIIVDEFQKIKNDTGRAHAVETICKSLTFSIETVRSRIIFLSGSPFDKYEQVTRMFKTLGIMATEKLTSYNPGKKIHNPEGFNNIYAYISKLHSLQGYLLDNDEVVMPVTYYKECTISTLEKLVYDLFLKIMLPTFSDAMIVTNTTMDPYRFASFYTVKEDDYFLLMKSALRGLDNMQTFQERGTNILFSDLVTVMKSLDNSYLSTIVRITHQNLQELPNCKIVICLTYHENIDFLKEAFSEYNPIIYNGTTVKSKKQREIALLNFQEPSLKYRILIGNVEMLKEGIDLDDKDGRFPRICLARPSFNVMSMYQLSCRFNRGQSTQSRARMEFLYACYENPYTHTILNERRIIDKIRSKTTILKDIAGDKQFTAGVVFPSDFIVYREGYGIGTNTLYSIE